MAVLIDSGEFLSAKGKTGGDLDRVLGRWQIKITSGFNVGAEWLLKAIDEVDELRLWETYWGGKYDFNKDRETFIARKLLVDFNIVEHTLPDILEKLRRGEPVELQRKDGRVVPLGKHGGNRKVDYQGDIVTLMRGNSLDYTLRRLTRDRPDLLARYESGELSANAAAIEAGFRKKRTPFEQAQYWYNKLTVAEKSEFLEKLAVAARENKAPCIGKVVTAS